MPKEHRRCTNVHPRANLGDEFRDREACQLRPVGKYWGSDPRVTRLLSTLPFQPAPASTAGKAEKAPLQKIPQHNLESRCHSPKLGRVAKHRPVPSYSLPILYDQITGARRRSRMIFPSHPGIQSDMRRVGEGFV